jgi:hypothetical protein
MKTHLNFTIQLENFGNEANVVAQYVYAGMAIQHAASSSKELLRKLNETTLFWKSSMAAFQSAAYIAIGRIFDTKSPYNVNALLNSMEAEINLFARPALADRKRNGSIEDPMWLTDYLDKAYYPTSKDVEMLRRRVKKYREIYDRAFKPVRNKYIAHREKQALTDVQAMFAQGKVKDLWRLVAFFLKLHDVLWQQLHNGRKPMLRVSTLTIKSAYKKDRSNSTPERIVADVKKLMNLIESTNA